MRRGRWEGACCSSRQPHTDCAHRAAAGERLWPHARQERGRAGAQASPKPGRGREHRRPHVVGVLAGPLLLLAAPRGATSPARPPATPARTHPFLCGNVEVVQGHMAGGGQQLQLRGRGKRAQWPLWLQEDGVRRTCKFWARGHTSSTAGSSRRSTVRFICIAAAWSTMGPGLGCCAMSVVLGAGGGGG